MTDVDDRRRFIEASADLAEALGLTGREAAAAAARYRDLKEVQAYVVRGGEVVDRDQYERELELLNARLKDYVTAYGPLRVEGQPDLVMQHPESEEADAPALAEHEPDVLAALVQARAVRIDVKLARKVLDGSQAGRLARFVHRVGGTPRLVFLRR